MNNSVKFQADTFFSFPRSTDESVSQCCSNFIDTDRHSFSTINSFNTPLITYTLRRNKKKLQVPDEM